jgi:16S rRNA (uracil1498-N3)-methyltransferase
VPPRFYVPDLDPARATVTLPPGESRHLTRVLRLPQGAAVEVFDGRGVAYAGVVADAHAAGVAVNLGHAIAGQPEPPFAITVCVALLKGDAMDAVVRDATVLGAARIVPIVTARTNVPRVSLASGRAHERWQRVAVAAAKQCGRAVLPTFDPVCAFDVLVRAGAARSDEAHHVMLVEPARADAHHGATSPQRGPAWLLVGPEGGWTDEEVADARQAGWTTWTLGPFTLRAEQVTLAALAVLRHAWDSEGCR